MSSAFYADHLFDAGNFQCIGIINAFHLGAIDWWTSHDRVEGILQVDIGAKNRLAGDNVFTIDGFGVGGFQFTVNQSGFLADKAQLAVGLQNQSIPTGDIQLSRCFCEIAKTKFPACG